MTATTAGSACGSRPRTSRASVRTSPPLTPSARCATTGDAADVLAPGRELGRRRPAAAAGADLLELLLGGAQPLDQVGDLPGQLVRLGLQQLGELARPRPARGRGRRSPPRRRAPRSGGCRRRPTTRRYHDGADLRGVRRRACHRRARATTGRRSRRRGPGVVVGLAEQRERAPVLGLLERHVLHADRQVGAQRLVRDLLDVADLRRVQRLRPAEVEAQVAGPVVGTGLQRVRAEHLAQRGVHDVRAGVRLAGADPPLGVDPACTCGAGVELALERPGPGARPGP